MIIVLLFYTSTIHPVESILNDSRKILKLNVKARKDINYIHLPEKKN